MLISDDIKGLLQMQWGKEVANSHFYLSAASYLKELGMINGSKLFFSHYADEKSHSEKIFNFILDMGSEFSPPLIPSVDDVFSSPIDVAEKYLNKEIETTESLDSIKGVSIEEHAPVVESFIQGMLDYQVDEYTEATEFYQKVKLAGDNLSVLDGSLGEG